MKQFRILISVFMLFASVTLAPAAEPTNAFIGWVGAAGSSYVGSAATQPLDILASDVCNNSYSPSMALDSRGYPCIAWSVNESSNYEIFFARWNGTTWVNASGAVLTSTNGNVSNNTNNSDFPKLVLDSNDNPCIAWRDITPGNYEIYFARWNGSSWVNASGTTLTATNGNMSNNAGSSVDPSLALDLSNNPCISWQDDTPGNFEIYFARWNGSTWVNVSGATLTTTNGNMSNNSGASLSPCLALDSNNRPHIAWGDGTSGNQNIFYASWDGSSWVDIYGTTLSGVIGTVIDDSGISANPCLMLDNSGYPCISWVDDTPGNYEILFARWNGYSWVNAENIDFTVANGNVSNDSNHSLNPSMKLDSSGKPCITWFDTSSPFNYEIFYARWNGSSWVNALNSVLTTTNANISQNSEQSTEPCLALDSNGNPNVAWSNGYNSLTKIFYVKFQVSFDGTFSITKSVDTNADGDFTDSGKTVGTGDTLTYRINWQFNQGQDPLENPYLYDTIPDGTTYVAGSVSPNANISYSLDSGATWTTGEPPNGSPAGTQLRWDLSSLWVGAAGSPYIGSAATQPMDINMSRNAGISQYSSIELDSKGNPNIAWRDNTTGNNEVFFVRWNGQNWVNINDVIYDPLSSNANVSNSSYNTVIPSLKLDKNDNPHITWGEDSYFTGVSEIVYVHWNGSNWLTANNIIYNPVSGNANISQNAGVSGNSQLELDSNNYPHITWNDFSYALDREICYICWNGSNWVTVNGSIYNPITGNCNVSQNVSGSYVPVLDVDSNNRPHIAWHDRYTGTDEMFYVYSDGNNWRVSSGVLYNPSNGNANISNNPGWSQYATLLIDSNDNPHISWIDTSYGNGEVLYTRLNGTNWLCADGSLYNPVTGNANVTKTTTDPYPFSVGHSMAIDKNNNPHISWTDVNALNNLDVYYIHWNNGQWFNDQGNIYIPSPNNANTTKSPSSSINSGHVLSIVTDSNDLPHMVFWDNYLGNLDILYIHLLGNSRDFSLSVKVDNPPTIPAFCNKATFRHKWDNGKAIESNEVCNTIDYNFTGTFTLEKGVDANSDGKYTDNGATVNPGTTLGYKIDWAFNNPNNDPLFSAYVYDQIPPGTKYIGGSATLSDLSHSLDGGTTWTDGEPADGALPGTILRWGSFATGWVGAAHSRYNGANVLQPYDINVTKGQMGASRPVVVVDSRNRPHMVWMGNNPVTWQTDVFYGRWDGTAWVNAAGLPLTYANSNITNDNLWETDATLTLDENDMPNIAWSTDNGGNRKIAFTKWNGTQWVNADGTPYSFAGSAVSTPADNAYFPSIDIDSSNRPCISWVGSSTSELIKFARWNGSSWVTVQDAALTPTNGTLAPGCINFQYAPSLKMNSLGNPCVSWQEFDINTYLTQIMYACWNGSAWVNTNGQAYSFDNWNISRLPGSSYVPSLQIDSADRPCVAWEYSYNWDYDINFIRWDGTQWTDASGATYNPGTNGNVSYPSNMSIAPDLELDPSDTPCLSWIDNGTGTDQGYFVRWNGTAWTTADGRVADATNPNVSSAPSHIYDPNLAIDSDGNPHMVWSGMANLDPEGPRDIIYVTYEQGKRTLYFGVKIDNPFTNMSLSPICNIATFSHVFDKGNQVVSNTACVKIVVNKGGANLVISKISKSFEYTPTDTFEFTIVVKNTGDVMAKDVVVTDLFPKELAFVSAVPSGVVGHSTVKFSLGDFNPGKSEIIKLKFKLSSKISIDDCVIVTNEAMASSGELLVKDSAVFKICAPKAPCPLYFDTKWTGLDKNIGKVNTQITGAVKVQCGSSPYTITIDWGDGTKSTGTIKNSNEDFKAEHTYSSTGSFKIKITVIDAYLSTRMTEKNVKIE